MTSRSPCGSGSRESFLNLTAWEINVRAVTAQFVSWFGSCGNRDGRQTGSIDIRLLFDTGCYAVGWYAASAGTLAPGLGRWRVQRRGLDRPR